MSIRTGRRPRDLSRAVAAGLFLTLAGAAQAHGSAPGLAGFATGFIHPLVEPAHLVALIALVLLIGQQGLEQTNPAIASMCIATGVGLLAAGLGWPLSTDIPLLVCAALSGVAVAVGRAWPRSVYAMAATVVGLGIGRASAPDGPRGGVMIPTMLGTWVGSCVWAINGVSVVEVLKQPWMRVLVRVVASWMAACALLFLALSVAHRRDAVSTPPVAPAILDVGR